MPSYLTAKDYQSRAVLADLRVSPFFAPAGVGQRGAVFRGRPRAIPAGTPQRRDDRGVAAERLAPRRRPVHDEVEAPAIPRMDPRGGGVAQPLLRDDLAIPADTFPRDAHPCSLHRLGAALEVARLGAGRFVAARAIHLGSAPGVPPEAARGRPKGEG